MRLSHNWGSRCSRILSNVYYELAGDGDGHAGTFEGRPPALDGKLQRRVRVPFQSLDSGFSYCAEELNIHVFTLAGPGADITRDEFRLR